MVAVKGRPGKGRPSMHPNGRVQGHNTSNTAFQVQIPTPCGAKRETKVTSSKGGFANHPDAYPAKSQDFGEHE